MTRYFVKTNDNPDSKDYGKPRGLFRFVPEPHAMQRWQDGSWVHWPSLIEAFGIGGSTDYHEIQENEVEGVKAKL